jgi:hypothetical protein
MPAAAITTKAIRTRPVLAADPLVAASDPQPIAGPTIPAPVKHASGRPPDLGESSAALCSLHAHRLTRFDELTRLAREYERDLCAPL